MPDPTNATKRTDPGDDWASSVLRSHAFPKAIADGVILSVIYPYFERPDHLLRSVASVLEEVAAGGSVRPDQVEVIVVDDGSADRTVADRLPPAVTYLWQRKIRFGASRARNTGAKLANGAYLFFLDPDIIVGPGYFDAALSHFAAHGDRLLLTGYVHDYHFPDAPDPRLEFGVWDVPDTPVRRFLHLASGSAAIPRSLFLEAGGFDEDLIYGGWEDMEFGHRVGMLPGTAMIYALGMECRHVWHPPSPRLDATDVSREICRIKHPEFYDLYFVQGMR